MSLVLGHLSLDMGGALGVHFHGDLRSGHCAGSGDPRTTAEARKTADDRSFVLSLVLGELSQVRPRVRFGFVS